MAAQGIVQALLQQETAAAVFGQLDGNVVQRAARSRLGVHGREAAARQTDGAHGRAQEKSASQDGRGLRNHARFLFPDIGGAGRVSRRRY